MSDDPQSMNPTAEAHSHGTAEPLHGPGEWNGAWTMVLATLPLGPRMLARIMSPFRHRIFSDELRMFARVMDGPGSEGIRQARDYLAHPRYRKGSLRRRLGLRCRVSLLEDWAESHAVQGTEGSSQSRRGMDPVDHG